MASSGSGGVHSAPSRVHPSSNPHPSRASSTRPSAVGTPAPSPPATEAGAALPPAFRVEPVEPDEGLSAGLKSSNSTSAGRTAQSGSPISAARLSTPAWAAGTAGAAASAEAPRSPFAAGIHPRSGDDSEDDDDDDDDDEISLFAKAAGRASLSAPAPSAASAAAAAASAAAFSAAASSTSSSVPAAAAAAAAAADDDDDEEEEDEDDAVIDPKDIPWHIGYRDDALDVRPLQGVLLPRNLRKRLGSMRDLLCDLVATDMDINLPSDLATLIGLFAVTPYRSRDAFATPQLYAQYVKRTLRAGMQVRVRSDSTETSDNVREMHGLYGIFLHSNMARPPCRCFWPGDGPPLKWINWSDIELLTDDESDPCLVRDAQRELQSYDWQQFGLKGAPSKKMVSAVLGTRIESLQRAFEANGVKPAWDEEDF